MNINKELNELKLILSDLKGRKLPEGRLIVRRERKLIKYYRRTDSGEKYINSKEDEIAALEEKHYIQKLIKTAVDNQQELIELQKRYKPLEQVFLEIPVNRRHLIKPYVLTSGKTLEKTISRVGKSNYVTLEGEYVRSKSEVIIADRLKTCGVTYCYEPALRIDFYEVWHPDFMAVNKRTGKVYYWEHFGMLDDQEYRESFQYKLEKYADNGIFTGDNLIITTETNNHQLNTEYVDCLIKHFLL